MLTDLAAEFLRPGTSDVELTGTDGPPLKLAVGYLSVAVKVGSSQWAIWQEAVEDHARRRELPMLDVYRDQDPTEAVGFARMVAAMRLRAHLRSGYVAVVIVPTIEHLSPLRDGSEAAAASLLRLHFGVAVQTATSLNAEASPGPLASGSAGGRMKLGPAASRRGCPTTRVVAPSATPQTSAGPW